MKGGEGGAEYRKNALKSYMAHSRQKEDGTCLMEFKYKTDRTSQAIGYAKSMMIFTMLESMLGGTEDFDKGIKIFLQRNMHKTAGWDDMIAILEDVSGIHLKGFIDGWLAETAIADFDISDIKSAVHSTATTSVSRLQTGMNGWSILLKW